MFRAQSLWVCGSLAFALGCGAVLQNMGVVPAAMVGVLVYLAAWFILVRPITTTRCDSCGCRISANAKMCKYCGVLR